MDHGGNERRRPRGHTMRAPHAHPERMPRLVARRKKRAKEPRAPLGHAWTGERHRVAAIESTLPEDGLGFTRRVVGNSVIYAGDVEVLGVVRRLVIIFRNARELMRGAPLVMASGPTDSPHRFQWARPTTLCMWQPSEPDSRRWATRTGLLGLIGISIAHLSEEALARVHGRWFTDEHRFEMRRGEGESCRNVRASRRVKSHQCWCSANKKYENCHGAIPEAEERELLGLDGPLCGYPI